MRKRWVWPFAPLVVATAAQCGFSLCDETAAPCSSQPVAGTHTIGVGSGFCGGCVIDCETGWLDCDKDLGNGCETPGTSCSSNPFADGGDAGSSIRLLATIAGAPHGIALCGLDVVYFDDDDLYRVTPSAPIPQRLTTSAKPAGGIACDGTFAVWATSPVDGGASGAIWELPAWADAASPVVTGIDPAPGVELHATSVYWIQRDQDAGPLLAHTTGDAGWTTTVSASETQVYKAFALTSTGAYTFDSKAIWFDPFAADAGGVQGLPPMANAVALVAGSSATPYAITADNLSDGITHLVADASTSAIPVIVAAAATKTTAVFAADDGIYAYDLQTNKLVTIAQPVLHAVDVTLDDVKHVYWTTRGEGVSLGGVWMASIP